MLVVTVSVEPMPFVDAGIEIVPVKPPVGASVAVTPAALTGIPLGVAVGAGSSGAGSEVVVLEELQAASAVAIANKLPLAKS